MAFAVASILFLIPRLFKDTAFLYSSLSKNSIAASLYLPALINFIVSGLPDNEPLYQDDTIFCLTSNGKLSNSFIFLFITGNLSFIASTKFALASSIVTESSNLFAFLIYNFQIHLSQISFTISSIILIFFYSINFNFFT